ncbi:hypothetical protein GTA08_BOTSDO11005 [Neofusicoccum parvum]|nr:hypothetical protein GTA08_BOTSDO11005 [Neofusicoccum parvum]
MDKWKAMADASVIRGLNQLPYCILCGAKHAWVECQTGWAERMKNQQRDRSKVILMDWLEKSADVDSLERDPIFCGFCESFGQHNTLNCHTTAEIYKQDEDQFLFDRFGPALASGYTVDGRKKHSKMYKPLVEKKCRMCRTTLPKAIKLDDQPEHEIIVACSNPRCKQLNLLPVESENESESSGGDNTWSGRQGSWGGINITTREQAATQLLAAAAKEWWPFLGGHNVTQDSKGQPYYEGPQCMTKAASQAFGTNKYDHNGWWHFNDPGNFQPMFPPATLHFTSTDKAVREEPNCPIRHTRAGLIPFCVCCGLFGTVVDDDEDIVMAQTGPSNEGDLAGAGAGIVSFENPLYQLGGRNPLGEKHYIPGAKCWCGVVFGAAPQIAWVKQRALAPQPKMQLDLKR